MITTKSQGVLQLDAGVELWNSTDGLCGRMDGTPENDLSHSSVASFANKWLVNGLNEICEPSATEMPDVSEDIVREALRFCSTIKTDRFKACSNKKLDTETYVNACKVDYTRCIMANGSDCGCSSVAAYAEECSGNGQTLSWRDDRLCR